VLQNRPTYRQKLIDSGAGLIIKWALAFLPESYRAQFLRMVAAEEYGPAREYTDADAVPALLHKGIELAKMHVGWDNGSADSKYVYSGTDKGKEQAIFRVRIADRRQSASLSLRVCCVAPPVARSLERPDPDRSPLLMRNVGSQESTPWTVEFA
jgi:hypothetical protein